MQDTDCLQSKVFAFLEGDWEITREVIGANAGRFKGSASFAPQVGKVGSYLYTERGEMLTDEDRAFSSSQQYLYRLESEWITVLKSEAASWVPMHQLVFRSDKAGAVAAHTHRCGEDDYHGEFLVDFDGFLKVDYRVVGPKKDYSIHSLYTKKSAPDTAN